MKIVVDYLSHDSHAQDITPPVVQYRSRIVLIRSDILRCQRKNENEVSPWAAVSRSFGFK